MHSPRRRRGPVDPQRDLERVAIDWVIHELRAEGLEVRDLWYPEHQPADPRIGGRVTRPDGAMLIDGHEAAIDVTGFWSEQRGLAAARARQVGELAEATIAAAHLGIGIWGFLIYDPDRLARMATDRAADAALLAEVALAAANQGPGRRVEVEPARLPGWAIGMTVTTTDWGRTQFSMWPRRDVAAEVSTRLAEIAERKGAQLADWGLGIVAIAPHGLDETAEDVAAGLASRDDWPFWRVYWQDAHRAHLVWARADGQEDHPLDPTPAAAS